MTTNFKLAATVAATTVSTGVSTWFDLIPDDIGKLASLAGLVLTVILIVIHTYKLCIDIKRNKKTSS